MTQEQALEQINWLNSSDRQLITYYIGGGKIEQAEAVLQMNRTTRKYAQTVVSLYATWLKSLKPKGC